MLINQCILDPLKRASWEKHHQLLLPSERHWEEFKDGMPNDAIEGESSHLEINSIFSPSMTILNVFEPISKPILDPDKSLYAPSTKLHKDPKSPSRHPKNRSHENYRNTQEEQQQWQECVEHIRNT